LGLAVLLGCERAESPEPLRGTWYSEDARYDGRSLVVHTYWIRFMDGTQVASAVRVDKVIQEGGGESPLRFEIEGVDRDGQATTLTFQLAQRPVERLWFETQKHAWRRTPRADAAS
jgi:hypothetical protein